jgi:transposase
LLGQGFWNYGVDSAGIEVNRRRRANSDGLDATKLVQMLIRWHQGERKVTDPSHRERGRMVASAERA